MMFDRPEYLWLLLILLPIIAWYVYKYKKANPSLEISSITALERISTSYKVVFMHISFVLRMCALAALIIALCRPQTHNSHRESQIEGTDIILAMDISGSMLSEDFKPNRFEAAKTVATQFVNARENDNIGLVIFAGESFSLMPLTNDRAAVINAIKNIDMSMLSDGTAVGDGLTSAINRISSGKAKSKSIILLTDGTNNSGDVPPPTAAQIAKQKGIRVYTIGIGTNGVVSVVDPYGFTTQVETKIDEESLKNIAQATGGKYFRAKDEHVLSDVFDEIDKLEKTKLDVQQYTRTEEDFMVWVLTAMILFVAELLLRYIILRRIP